MLIDFLIELFKKIMHCFDVLCYVFTKLFKASVIESHDVVDFGKTTLEFLWDSLLLRETPKGLKAFDVCCEFVDLIFVTVADIF